VSAFFDALDHSGDSFYLAIGALLVCIAFADRAIAGRT
jgi:hypothetical protein